MSADPLEQFEVKSIISLPRFAGMNIDFTNSSLYMLIAAAVIILIMELATRRTHLVPGRLQSSIEAVCEFVSAMLRDNVGADGRKFFPLIFTLFIFVLSMNLLGMTPYSFTVTSHISVTLTMAMFIFLGVTLIALFRHGLLKFLGFFIPDGTPWWMMPIMFFIEIFAYLARPISLSVRLTANMLAGHTMLKVIASFVVALGFLGGWLPLLLLTILIGFEIFVAILQAYIFAILTCVYLNDALHLH